MKTDIETQLEKLDRQEAKVTTGMLILMGIVLFFLGYCTALNKLDHLRKYEKFDRAMSEATKHQYDKKTYNCLDFSNDARQKLKELGISSSIIAGVPADDKLTRHAFIGVWFEPQTGEFMQGEYLNTNIYK